VRDVQDFVQPHYGAGQNDDSVEDGEHSWPSCL
jgi:hypothetical protein